MSDRLSDNLSSLDDDMVPDKDKITKQEVFSNDNLDSLDDDELNNDDINVKKEANIKKETYLKDELDSEISNNGDKLDDLSELSDDYEKGVKQPVKVDYDNDELSDDYANENQERERKKNNKKKEKRRRQIDRENKQPRMSEKENQQIQQEKFGDDEAEELMNKMQEAFDSDIKSQKRNQPYIKKILLCNDILNKLNNSYVRKSFSEDQGLSELNRWFKQAYKDNSLTLIKKIIKIIQKMDMSSDNISTSALVKDLARIRHQIVHNTHQNSLLDKDAETSIVSIVDSWAPLFIRNRYEQDNEYQDMEDDLKGEAIGDDQY
ncbi:hypothetical protein PPERSA_02347 [Pseudocohnilembus persalinus]|uniref:Uncharacterized protein n=1 Tax=Pseudocohnilembus persalinus TaxID=266149 RepID=A0A0V0QUB4_PSEPJ|nr:hypothetical protein PPERSA_02347 [Pseudocohnilembus persalinus]|eukprot:KRX05815.1 hypothetical protein PPERSA_02347 [Pseudocohnilembus persalinus]